MRGDTPLTQLDRLMRRHEARFKPQQFRKKPVVIEAMRLTEHSMPDVSAWCGGKLSQFGSAWSLVISTLEGDMRADEYDWIIRGVKGEFYPCKPDIFNATYERVETTDARSGDRSG
jgi:hypothetical protein